MSFKSFHQRKHSASPSTKKLENEFQSPLIINTFIYYFGEARFHSFSDAERLWQNLEFLVQDNSWLAGADTACPFRIRI